MKLQPWIVFLSYCFMPLCHGAIAVKPPIPTTVPLHAKVYSTTSLQQFQVNKSSLPKSFKSFDSIVTNYSWKYISKIRPNEFGYVLLGYEDKASAKQSASILFSPDRVTFTEPPADPAASLSANSSAPNVKTDTSGNSPSNLLFEVKVMCTNISGVPLRKDQIDAAMEGGKVYGASFDLKAHKNCYIVAKKQNDSPEAVREFIEKIYGGVLGVGGALE